MSNLKKELIKEIIVDGGFSNSVDIENYLRDMFKDVLQEMLEQELSNQLGYEKGDNLNKNTSNRRNWYNKKTVKSQYGDIELDILRDREGDFEPVIVHKNTRDISGIEEK